MVNVIGLGYIGLPTALMLASHGVEVVGTDKNEMLVNQLKKHQVTFTETGLEELFNQAVSNGICFTNEYQQADIYIVAVPTPFHKEDKKLDSKYLVSATKSILEVCKKDAVIIIESTISPRTIDKYIRPLVDLHGFTLGKDIHLAHAPERLLPGKMIDELVYNPRTIGADSKEIGQLVKKLYQSFCKGDILLTDIKSAEMSKVIENTYRDINIAFANELAKICRRDEMDVYEIIRLANMHPRVNILQPGPGVGGHCISVDPWFLVGDYPDLTNLILTARKINDSMPKHVLGRIRVMMKEHGLKDITRIGLYGMTYKENVDDIRESPTMKLLSVMDNHLAFGVKAYDPFIVSRLVDNQYFDFDRFLSDIDILVVMVGHDHLLDHVDKIKDKLILDTRHVLDQEGIYQL
ncbi:nucleotide sugar dehydrogenase [Acidaminobacter sp. JC074]|uniref:nucleotide sugar dehydrogenase n=1 Tax=Acidaminobacter sp. JC074 TaxID=2530199 RepID=UPI001F0D9DF6|nr:nucleotide sugar dehydrogenase [Acidaminobacter sp. JC074]MCH4889716.1 nucleotide sugar dehydrogenase [Acidaminobacter sp. JC074]